MNMSIRQFFGRPAESKKPAIPPGRRVYAMGDIHGRLDLFKAAIKAIERDIEEDGADDAALQDDFATQAQHVEPTVILLGDLIDRGPDSAGVLKRARKWKKRRDVHILGGNHEEMFLESFDKKEVLRHFLRFGGKETLQSYGIDPQAKNKAQLASLQARMADYVPAKDLEFIRSFEEQVVIGDYAFVHAGIHPSLTLEKQDGKDLRWIREPFLSHEKLFSHVIVHGHTIYSNPEIRDNRIGIDTGAFETGRLTVLVLEGTGRKIMETSVKNGTIKVSTRKVEE